MNIRPIGLSPTNTSVQQQEYARNQSSGANEAKSVQDAATVSLSQSASLQEKNSLQNASPDERAKRVSELKSKVEEGRYSISSKELSETLFRDLL